MPTEYTIDVRAIPGPQRHPQIVQTFDSLAPGHSLEILNDHDPFPLHDRFKFMKRGQFDWTYLQQGPDLWRVRIAKLESAQAPPASTR
jgi:uncharacterized protein (DUF2249 family)